MIPLFAIVALALTMLGTAGAIAASGKVAVPAGADIQKAINANPDGTTFQLEAGTYAVSSTINPKAGDIFLGAGQGSTILDGGRSSFNGIDSTGVSGVQVRSLTLQHFYDALHFGPGGLAQDIEAGANAQAGVYVAGDGTVVNACYVHDNGRFGIYVNRASSVQVVGNQLVNNHTSSAWSNDYAAGIKVINFNSGVLVKDNVVTGTTGRGIWTDYDASGTQIVGNTVLGSTEEGIRVEKNFSTVVQQNVTDTGIVVLNSSGTLVQLNQTAALGTDSPLSFAGDGRTKNGVEYVNANNRASSNDVTLAPGQKVGVIRVAGTTYGNSFDANTYHVPSATTSWFKWWTGTASKTLTWTGWQDVGQDLSGTLGGTATVLPPTSASFTPTRGPVGTPVTITGTNLSGATSVGFNGLTATAFTVDSDTQITATVPAGATTGKITVTTPGGTATSASGFTVQHARHVALHLSVRRVKGSVSVTDGFSACASSVPVKVQQLVNGRWRTLASGRTHASGAYSLVWPGHGRFRTIARRMTLGSGDVCPRAISPTARR